jgi:diaminopimelate decarboxylase
MQPEIFKNNTDLSFKDGILHIGVNSIEKLAEKYGTPLYIYSEKVIVDSINSYQKGLHDTDHILCYAVKASSNIGLIQIMARNNCGADIVSGGELFRALKAGITPSKIVYSGVGKTDEEIRFAIESGILMISAESEAEITRISSITQELKNSGKDLSLVNISIRVNPDVDAGTHPYISTGLTENKFGIEHKEVMRIYGVLKGLPGLRAAGIGFHIGSQLTSLNGFKEAASLIKGLISELRDQGIPLKYLDMGGGLGIRYEDENPPSPEDYVKAMLSELNIPDITYILEPGRSIIGPAGIFVTRILYTKNNTGRTFHICDGGMNDLIRPSLYQAYHHILSQKDPAIYPETETADLVGPVCESGDFFAKNRDLPKFQRGDLAVLLSAGAYGMAMSSRYNSRRLPAEVLIGLDGKDHLIRKRESYEDMILNEIL